MFFQRLFNALFYQLLISIAPASEMIQANVVGCWATSNPLGTFERSDGDDRLVAAAAAGSGKNLEEAGLVDED